MRQHALRVRAGAWCVLGLALLGALISTTAGAQSAAEPVDTRAIARIRTEATQRSQLMDVLSYLTDVHGPRLTGSPALRGAADYVVRTLAEWGVANPRLEPWGPFGRGWANERFTAHVIAPQPYPLIGYPLAWTPGTSGPIEGDAVRVTIESTADFAKWQGSLAGAIVFTEPAPTLEPRFTAEAERFSDEDLDRLASPPAPRGRGRGRRGNRPAVTGRRRLEFFRDEGVAAVVTPGRGRGGTVFVTAVAIREDPSAPPIPQISLAAEHYGRIVRTLEHGVPVRLELDVRNVFYDDAETFNVVAELPGTDKADERVLIGAHLDSWHAGTGATDNAAGVAVMMEVMRILAATDLELRRTVQLGLWTGEENGFLGSRAYVKAHVADRSTMALEPGHARLSAYYNHDNGTGAIRGVYLQGNDAVAPIFSAWMAPFRDEGMTTLARRGTNGTDHVSFDEVGIPGFQFIQDPLAYDSLTHHSNMDLFEHINKDDLIRNAAIIATFVYHTANREARLPRTPLPRPRR